MSLARTFKLHKHGELVDVRFVGTDTFKKQETYVPIDSGRIVGVDTESLTKKGKLTTVLVPLRFSTGDQLIEAGTGTVLEKLLDSITGRFEVDGSEIRESQTKQRTKRKREHGNNRRDGRRVDISPVLLVFFNLPYDLGRLCSDQPQLLRAIGSGADTYFVDVGNYRIEVAKMVLNHGAIFEWFVRNKIKNSITRIIAIDMVGYWKTSLAKAAKSLGVTEKIDIDSEVFTKPFEAFTFEEWITFKEYALGDVQTTLELYHATVALLSTIDEKVIRRNGVIPPSAPGAAARITFAKAFSIHTDKTTWKRYPAWADQMGCDAYFGGRAFCVKPGIFEGLNVLDLKSAYAYAMCQLPDPVTVECKCIVPRDIKNDQLLDYRGKFGVMYVSGHATDAIYPAFRIHDTENNRLRYVYGEFHNLPMTIPELIIGIESGVLEINHIHKGVIMQGSSEDSFLRVAMQDFFAIKNDESNEKALRDMAKLLGNSTYGKLIEVQHTQHFLDSELICPVFENGHEVVVELARLYAECPASEFDDRASVLIEHWQRHKIRCESLNCKGCGPEPIDKSKPALPIRRGLSHLKRYKCGQYFMPLYAAQITGLVSACLGLMARITKAIQGDTDSVHGKYVTENSEYYSVMERAGYDAPKTGIGCWELETKRPSIESVLVRPKMYSHRLGLDSFKQAKHGFSKYPNGQSVLHEVMKQIISRGNPVEYESKASPRKLREALIQKKEIGEFIRRDIQVSFVQDPNMYQVDGINLWKPM